MEHLTQAPEASQPLDSGLIVSATNMEQPHPFDEALGLAYGSRVNPYSEVITTEATTPTDATALEGEELPNIPPQGPEPEQPQPQASPEPEPAQAVAQEPAQPEAEPAAANAPEADETFPNIPAQGPEPEPQPQTQPDVTELLAALLSGRPLNEQQRQAEEQYSWAGGETTRYDPDEDGNVRTGMMYTHKDALVEWADNPYMGDKKNRAAIIWGVDNSGPEPVERAFYLENNTVYNYDAFKEGRAQWVNFEGEDEEIPPLVIKGEPWELLPGYMPSITVTHIEVDGGDRRDYGAKLTDEKLATFELRGKDPFDEAHDVVWELLRRNEAARRGIGTAAPTPATPAATPRPTGQRVVVNVADLNRTSPPQPAAPTPPQPAPRPVRPIPRQNTSRFDRFIDRAAQLTGADRIVDAYLRVKKWRPRKRR